MHSAAATGHAIATYPMKLLFAAHPIVHVNASLNAIATILLLLGLWFVKRGHIEAHKRAMLMAFGASVAFLACYLWYHIVILRGEHVRFTYPGFVRHLYYTILASHVVLAATVPFLAVWQIYLGFRSLGYWRTLGDQTDQTFIAATARQKHIRLARWTYPIWLYVSVTGVLIYLMLYYLWPTGNQ